MPLSVRGQIGQLKVGYQTAAELGPWELSYGPQPDNPEAGPPQGWTFSATIGGIDGFWGQRDTFDLILSVGPQRWKWRQVHTTIPINLPGKVNIQGEGRPEIS